MNIAHYLSKIQIHLIKTHSQIFDWFDVSVDLKTYRPQDGGWTISEILEHIALTSHFLLKLIDKASDKALRTAAAEEWAEVDMTATDINFDAIEDIGIHKSFSWIRPEHMEPTGTKAEIDIKTELASQLHRCLSHLDKLKNGEGLLYKTTMTVHDLGKLNVYEYIYFLSKHAERHLHQMHENKTELLSI